MKPPPAKYFTQIVANFFTNGVVLLPSDQLFAHKEVDAVAQRELDRSHIYMVCRRPASAFDPLCLQIKDGRLKTNLVWRAEGATKRHPIDRPINNPDGGDIRLGPYPHRELVGFDSGGNQTRSWRAMHDALMVDVPEVRDFEVLYVGQSYGRAGRSAVDRLRSHSTLQRIPGELMYSQLDDEVALFLFPYAPGRLFAKMDPAATAQVQGEEDRARFGNAVDRGLSEKQEIAVIEAGLIRYFQPPYNEKLKDSFPASTHRFLQELYELDLDGCIVEVNTEDVRAPLYSRVRGPGLHHIAQFDFHNPAERLSFFSIIDEEGNYHSYEGGPTF